MENVNDIQTQSLAEVAGVTQAEAAKAIAAMNDRFNAQQAQIASLQKLVISQQAEISKTQAAQGFGKSGGVAVIDRHCNHCGARVDEGKRCPKHRAGKINEIGFGQLHNRMQPIILRQV